MKKILLFAMALLALGACVEDNGNYKYTEVNEVEVVLPELYARVYLEDRTVRIEPRLTQTLAAGNENLTYTWRYSTLSANAARRLEEPMSTEPYVDLEISSNSTQFNHYYWLEIHDALTGLTYPFHTRVQLVKPFVNVWAVLHEGDDGAAKLGAVEYVLDDSPIVHTDVFGEFGYRALTGRPVALGEDNEERAAHESYAPPVYNLLYLMTSNADESGLYAPWQKFTPHLFDVMLPRMVDNYASSGFDPALTTYVHKPNSDGATLINGGTMFRQSGSGMKIYKAKVDQAVTGAITITHAARMGGLTVMFDGAGRRFLYYTNGSNQLGDNNVDNPHNDAHNTETIKLMGRAANPAALDGIEHEVLHIGILPRQTASVFRSTRSFAIANGAGGKSYVYLFPQGTNISNTGTQSVTEVKEIATPAGLDAASRFASGTQYNNISFYSSGSAVYRLDFITGTATRIYDHGAAGGGTVAAMRIAKQEPPSATANIFDHEPYGHDPGRSLGVAINRGSSGEMVVLTLNEAGQVLNSRVYTGFGLIKDIAFAADLKQ